MKQTPIIVSVPSHIEENSLITMTVNYKNENGSGEIDFQINRYEVKWFYDSLGMNARYSSFGDFWTGANDSTKNLILFLLVADERNYVSRTCKSKIRKSSPAKVISMHNYKNAA